MVMIEITDIHKSFKDQQVLKGVKLRVESGQNLIILGRSGTGMSTGFGSILSPSWYAIP